MSSVTMDTSQRVISKSVPGLESGKILGMRLANERRGHNVMSSLIGWAHKQNDHCEWISPVFLARNVCVSKKTTTTEKSHFDKLDYLYRIKPVVVNFIYSTSAMGHTVW